MPPLQELSEEEKLERQFKQKKRELKIGRARSFLLRKQIIEAYEILENIRFDYLGDTMFRDYIVSAKRELEGAMSDFLLSDNYWEDSQKRINEMTPESYNESMVIKESPEGTPIVLTTELK